MSSWDSMDLMESMDSMEGRVDQEGWISGFETLQVTPRMIVGQLYTILKIKLDQLYWV